MRFQRPWWALAVALACAAQETPHIEAPTPLVLARRTRQQTARIATVVEAPAPAVDLPAIPWGRARVCDGRPQAPPISQRDRGRPVFCPAAAREISRGGWEVELVGVGLSARDERNAAWLWSDGCLHRLLVFGHVPRSGGGTFDVAQDADFDADGTVVFLGRADDQPNLFATGIYRLDGRTARPLVDLATRMPGRSVRFTGFGVPDIDGGHVAFSAGHDVEASGIYLWTREGLITIADDRTILPMSEPILRQEVVVFQGEDHGRRGLYRWTLRSRRATKLIEVGDAIPGDPGSRIDQISGAAIGDGIVYAHVRSGQDRVILAWHDDVVVPVARGDWFVGADGLVPEISSNISADGGALAFATVRSSRIGQSRRIQVDAHVWVAEGCAVERVVSTGEAIAGSTLRSMYVTRERGLVGRVVHLRGQLADGRQVQLRARPRAPH